MVNERGPIVSQSESRLNDNMDTVRSPPIKSKLISKLNNLIVTRNSREPKNLKSKITNKFSDLRICHQNIRGLRNKTDELLIQWVSQSPHILCLKEHQLTHCGLDTSTDVFPFKPWQTGHVN
jgi:hypothetical protein